jgi:hypothetical protein
MKYGLAITAVIIAAFVAIFVIVRHSPTPPKDAPKQVTLSDYDNQNAMMSVTIQGKVVGEDQRRAIRVSVTPTERRLEVLNGYNESVEKSQTYPNTEEGYVTFLRALSRAGFVRGRTSTITDFRGVCPLGSRYVYEVTTGNGDTASRLWGTSCAASEGTMAGSGPLVRQLFQAQIPDYYQQTSNVRL